MSDINKYYDEFDAATLVVNDLADVLTKKQVIFFRLDMVKNLKPERILNTKASFVLSISWMYALIWESTLGNLSWIKDKLKTYGIGESFFIYDVRNLRTYFQHGLNREIKGNLVIIDFCEDWIRDALKDDIYFEPNSVHHWECINIKLYETGIEFLKLVIACLRNIEEDKFKEIVIVDWIRKNKVYVSEAKLFDIVNEVIIENAYERFIKADYLIAKYKISWLYAINGLKSEVEIKLKELIEKDLYVEITKVKNK